MDYQRRRRLRGDVHRGNDEDEFENAYGRTLAMQSRWGRTVLAFRRVRREFSIVWDILIIVTILAIALGADIYYITLNHKINVESIETTYKKQIEDLKQKFQTEISSLSNEHSQIKDGFIDAHKEHSSEMRLQQKEKLEEMVKNMNDKLRDLVDAADQQWQDHDEFHNDGDNVDDVNLPFPKITKIYPKSWT